MLVLMLFLVISLRITCMLGMFMTILFWMFACFAASYKLCPPFIPISFSAVVIRIFAEKWEPEYLFIHNPSSTTLVHGVVCPGPGSHHPSSSSLPGNIQLSVSLNGRKRCGISPRTAQRIVWCSTGYIYISHIYVLDMSFQAATSTHANVLFTCAIEFDGPDIALTSPPPGHLRHDNCSDNWAATIH